MKMKLFLLPVTMLFAVVTPSKAQTESPFDSVQQIKEVVISTTRIPEMKSNRSEERRVGKECRNSWVADP